MRKLTEREEDILESLWVEVKERGRRPETNLIKDELALQSLVDGGLVDTKKDTLLTEEGMKEARLCIRRHRLAERLVADILDVRDELVHETSCKFEHGLHHGIEDSVCTLLGHPRTCPHGHPIPEGDCCRGEEVAPGKLIMSLRELKPGQSGKVSYINTRDADVLKRLISMGILPGNEIKLLHRFPSYVFEMKNASFAIDAELAENIHVLALGTEGCPRRRRRRRGRG